MELTRTKEKLAQMAGKYKYAFLILLLGLGLMLWPQSEPEAAEIVTENPSEDQSLEQMLEEILSQIDGAGQVRVLLTERVGEETLYQTDTQSDSSGERIQQSASTVITEDSQRQESGLIRRTDAPVYRGAVVVCQGADLAQVRLAIVEAVRCVTGLGADEISVVKMK